MIYTITGRIPSKKNSKQIFVNRKTGGRFITSSRAWKNFENGAIWELKSQFKKRNPYKGDLYIDYTFLMKGKGATDVDNLMSGVNDLLQKAGVIEDDKNILSGSFRKIVGQPEYFTEVSIQKL